MNRIQLKTTSTLENITKENLVTKESIFSMSEVNLQPENVFIKTEILEPSNEDLCGSHRESYIIKTKTDSHKSSIPGEVKIESPNEATSKELNVSEKRTNKKVIFDPLAVCAAHIEEVNDEDYLLSKFVTKKVNALQQAEMQHFMTFSGNDTDTSQKNVQSKDQEQMPLQYELVGKNKKKYICSICGKEFGDKSNLNRHIRLHTGIKPYTCDVCQKSFNHKHILDNHMIIHTGAKPHVCNVCERAFNNRSNLVRHKLVHIDARPYSCDQCDVQCRDRTDLVRHKLIHTGDKPYSCDLCDKAFVLKHHLTQHRRLHTGEKPYSCIVCKKSFTQQSTLDSHKKTHIT